MDRKPLSDDEIIDLVIGQGWIDRLCDTDNLEQDKITSIAMVRAIEQAHGIGVK